MIFKETKIGACKECGIRSDKSKLYVISFRNRGSNPTSYSRHYLVTICDIHLKQLLRCINDVISGN